MRTYASRCRIPWGIFLTCLLSKRRPFPGGMYTLVTNVEGVETTVVIIMYTVQCTVLINVEGVEAILVIIVYTVQCTCK